MDDIRPRRGFASEDDEGPEIHDRPAARRFAPSPDDVDTATTGESQRETPSAGPRRGLPASVEDAGDSPLAPRRGVPLPTDVVERREERRRVRWMALAVALTLALLIAVVYVLFGTSDRQSRAVPAPPATTRASVAAPAEPQGTPETIGDTTITVPSDWELYADETTEGDRRLIRIREPESGTTMQITTLTTLGEDLVAMCEALVADQRQSYEVDTEQVPMNVSVDGDASAVVCGFGGTKGDADSSIQFTLVQRDSDAHTLVMRSIQDRALAPDAAAAGASAGLKCEAARNFGTPLPLC